MSKHTYTLLPSDGAVTESQQEFLQTHGFLAARKSFVSRCRRSPYVHFFLFAVYTFTFMVLMLNKTQTSETKPMFGTNLWCKNLQVTRKDFINPWKAPALDAIVYEKKIVDSSDSGRFSGRPSLTLDKAWHEILRCECFI